MKKVLALFIEMAVLSVLVAFTLLLAMVIDSNAQGLMWMPLTMLACEIAILILIIVRLDEVGKYPPVHHD